MQYFLQSGEKLCNSAKMLHGHYAIHCEQSKLGDFITLL